MFIIVVVNSGIIKRYLLDINMTLCIHMTSNCVNIECNTSKFSIGGSVSSSSVYWSINVIFENRFRPTFVSDESVCRQRLPVVNTQRSEHGFSNTASGWVAVALRVNKKPALKSLVAWHGF